MNIYKAIHCVYMGISLREKNSEGKTIKVHKVEFTNGFTAPNFGGGTLATKDPVLIKLLDESPRNVKNGGSEWKLDRIIPEVGEDEKPAKTKKEAQPAAKTVEPVSKAAEPVKEIPAVEPEKAPEPVQESAKEVTVFADITTVQFAGAKLRELDPSIKTIEVRTKAQIATHSERLKVSFPNL